MIRAPLVIADAHAHGLVVSSQGRLHDRRKGERLPGGVGAMPPLPEAAPTAR